MRVIVYKNLRRGDWSIATATGRDGTGRGKVIGHAETVALAAVVFHVSESGRQRVIRAKAREVHAWAIGDIVDSVPPGLATREVTYNPYRCGAFHARDGAPIARADFVEFRADHVAVAYNPS
jgi:hypothetical protein